MILEDLRWVLLAGAVVLAVAAVVAGANEATALPASVAAALLAGLSVVVLLIPRTRVLRRALPEYERDSMVALRAAFREGSLGRLRIAQAVGELELAAFGRTGPHASDLAVRAPEQLTAEEFRAWVQARLDELERLT